MALISGTKLGPYEIQSSLGAGGMGEVYRATDTKLARDVALKVLPAEMAHDPERLGRFRLEAKALAQLDHPNIVTIHSVEECSGIHFLTMQLADGLPLDRLIPHGGLPVEQIIEIASALGDALAAAHEKGIVHRDLKPANVMVSNEGRVKVLDFGDERALQLCDCAENGEHHLAHRSGRVHLFRQAHELNAQSAERLQRPQQVRHRPGESVELPNDDRIESSPVGVGHQAVQRRPFVRTAY